MRPFIEEDLDFQDYYRASPEVPISTLYENSPDNRKQLRDMLESQKLREMEVQSLKEGRGQTN